MRADRQLDIHDETNKHFLVFMRRRFKLKRENWSLDTPQTGLLLLFFLCSLSLWQQALYLDLFLVQMI
jgi:hypothetical protein